MEIFSLLILETVYCLLHLWSNLWTIYQRISMLRFISGFNWPFWFSGKNWLISRTIWLFYMEWSDWIPHNIFHDVFQLKFSRCEWYHAMSCVPFRDQCVLRPWQTRTHCCGHKCFPICLHAQHLLRTQILCPQQMFPSLRSPRNNMGNNVSATMCPCLPGLYSKIYLLNFRHRMVMKIFMC